MDTIGNIRLRHPTAATLVLDLLVAHGGILSADVLCRSGGLFGMREATIRVALTRLVAAGKIARPLRGCYAIDRAAVALSRTIDEWRSRQARAGPWRGEWLAVQDAGVPRSDKTAWRHHGLALSLRGFAPLRASLHVRPDNLEGGLKAERNRLAALGLSSKALVFRLAGLDAAGQIQAASLWDVRRLADDHRRLRAALERSGTTLARRRPESALVESLLLGRTVIGHLLRDPVLPSELMSPATRDELLQATKNYQDDAMQLWRRWFDAPAGTAAQRIARRPCASPGS